VNKQVGIEAAPITHKNFQERVGDLLGVRIICLRLSDIKKVEAYLELLVEEKYYDSSEDLIKRDHLFCR